MELLGGIDLPGHWWVALAAVLFFITFGQLGIYLFLYCLCILLGYVFFSM
jgi:hypothetical protein